MSQCATLKIHIYIIECKLIFWSLGEKNVKIAWNDLWWFLDTVTILLLKIKTTFPTLVKCSCRLTDIIMIICYTEIHSRDTSSIEYFCTWLSNITWIVCFHLLRSKQLSKAKQAVPPTQTRDTPSSTALRAELWRSSPTVYCVSSFSCEQNWTNNIHYWKCNTYLTKVIWNSFY